LYVTIDVATTIATKEEIVSKANAIEEEIRTKKLLWKKYLVLEEITTHSIY
jgi:hypothetical protein